MLRSILTCVLLSASAAAAPQLPPLPFGNQEVPVGDLPRGLAVGDLDGDGDDDLAVAAAGDGLLAFTGTTVQVLRNDGGVLAAPLDVQTGVGPHRVEAADVDLDGDLDLVVVTNVSGLLEVLTNAGDGATFVRSTTDGGVDPWGLGVGDLDADGDPDAAVTQLGTPDVPERAVRVFENRDGRYVPVVEPNVGLRPAAVEIADLDDDGDGDLVVANFGSGTVQTLRHDGGFAFTSVAVADANSGFNEGPGAIAVADLDGDLVLDVAVAQAAGTLATGRLSIFRGLGGGLLGPEEPHEAGEDVRDVVAGDLDGDGDVDVVASSKLTSQAFVFTNDGGTLSGAPVEVGSFAVALALLDLDGDGVPDLATAAENVDHVAAHLGRGDGTFESDHTLLTSAGLPRAMRLAQLDGDGLLDAVLTGSLGLVVLPGLPDGTFGTGTLLAANAFDTVVVDLDGDGVLDLASVERFPGRVLVRPNVAGAFPFVGEVPLGTDAAETLAAGDLDGDGDADLAVVTRDPAEVRVLLNQGDATFVTGGAFPWDAGGESGLFAQVHSRSALVDLDGDGALDLVAMPNDGVQGGAPDDRLLVLPGDGAGGFGPAATHPVPPASRGLALADLDGDGALDAIVAVHGPPTLEPAHGGETIAVLHGTGDGGFAPAVEHPAGPGPLSVATADVDRDGALDVLVATGARNVAVLRGDGAGGLAELARFGTRRDAVDLAATDLDGDGRVDVVAATPDLAHLSVLLGREIAPAAAPPYGCGLAPAGSLALLSGGPVIGATLVLGVDDPGGVQAPGALPFVAFSAAPDPAFPCGTPVPGLGLAGGGAPGELLVALAPPQLLHVAAGPPWAGPGAPAPVAVELPPAPALVGTSLFAQGALVDPTPGAALPVGLTAGVELVVGR